jgi:hypothetical protein
LEKTLKFRFFGNHREAQVSPSIIHLHWIQAVQELLGMEVQVMNNEGQVMSKVDTMRWTTNQHGKQFKVYQSSSRSRIGSKIQGQENSPSFSQSTFIIIHRIRTSVPLPEIKSIPKVYKLLGENNCFLTEHRWTEDVWDTTQLGFILGLDLQFYDIATATEKVRNELKNKLPAKRKMSKCQLAFTTPQITLGGKVIKTKAYALETLKVDSMDMLKNLKHAYRDSNAFVPFQMRSEYPEAYSRCIYQQTKSMSGNYVFIMNNVSTDAMYYLSDHIRIFPEQKAESLYKILREF